MALTQISDVVVPEVFSPYTLEKSISENALISSGLIRLDERISLLLAGGGSSINVPFTKSMFDDFHADCFGWVDTCEKSREISILPCVSTEAACADLITG